MSAWTQCTAQTCSSPDETTGLLASISTSKKTDWIAALRETDLLDLLYIIYLHNKYLELKIPKCTCRPITASVDLREQGTQLPHT